MNTHVILIPLLCTILGTSCTDVSKQPTFITITGKESEPVKMVKTVQLSDNAVRMYFSNQVQVLSAHVFMPQTGDTHACTFKAIQEQEAEVYAGHETSLDTLPTAAAFSFTPLDPISVGTPFVVCGSISDLQHGVLDFALPFEGANTHPAKLRITEIRPLYGNKPKSEFIEFIVLQGGNLAGITITNVGDKQKPDYQFPPAEVSKGEVIVYHWRSVEDTIRDELTPHIVSGGTQSCPTARDFWGAYKSLPKRNANAILVKTGIHGDIQDAILYCTKKEFTKRGAAPTWNDEALAQDAKAAVANGVWHGEGPLAGAVIAPITASKSLVRNMHTEMNTAAAWTLRKSKAVTMGIVE